MSLQIILGLAKTGKSTKIYENIRNDILNNRNVILFVPSFMKVKAEEEYMNFINTSGLIGVNITTISDFIENGLKKFNFNFETSYLNKIDKKLILADIIKNEKSVFNMFSKVKNKQGFINNLSIYMDLIRKSGIDINADIPKFKNKLLEKKFCELLNIYEKYERKLSENYVDYVEEMNIFLSEVFSKVVDFKNTKIYFDGYNNFNKSEYLFIEKLLEKKIEIMITLCTDISSIEDIYLKDSTLEIFNTVNKTYLKLLNIANRKNISVQNIFLDKSYNKAREDIKFLADNLYKTNFNVFNKKSSNVILNLVTDPYIEINSIARIINKKIKQGYRYNDFLIYTTNIDEYDSIVKRCFYEYSIPVYSNIKFSMLDSSIIKYINILVLIASDGYRKDNIISILKLYLNSLSVEEVSLFENYLKEFNIFNLENEFNRNNTSNNDYIYDLEKLNEIRKNILYMFADIVDLGKTDNSIEQIVEVIYNHLIDKNVLNNHEKMLNKLKEYENDQMIQKLAIEEQVWKNLILIFISLRKILKNEKVNIKYFNELFNMLLDTIELKTIPKSMDQVELANINEYSSEVKKVVFFVGVNENKFPNIESEDILFKDSELEDLESKDLFLKETVVDKQRMVEYNIYKALNNISEKLYIFIPSSDISLNTLRKSSMVTNIQNILGIQINSNLISDNSINNDDLECMSKDEIFEMMIKLIDNDDEVDYDFISKIYKYYKEDERYKNILEYTKEDKNLDIYTIKKIFGDELNTSVSRLELFNKCPFSYFMNYSLALKERKEFEISSLDIGSFLHEVLEEFSLYLYENNIYWHYLLIDEEFKKVEDKLEEIIDQKVDKILKKNNTSIRFNLLKNRLYNTIKKVVTVIATSFNQSFFKPEGYEITFSKNGIYAPIRIKIDEDNYMNIIGKIDRIDTYENEEQKYVRIVDYKSSARDLNIEDIKEGLSLQLITYLDAYIKNKKSDKEVIPAAMLYFNLSNKVLNMSEFIGDEEKIKKELTKKLKLKGIFLSDINILEKMDKNFKTDTSLIDITPRSINGKKALKQDEYILLLKETEGILKKIGKSILQGTVRINPNKKADYCKYCKYSNVCRKDICL